MKTNSVLNKFLIILILSSCAADKSIKNGTPMGILFGSAYEFDSLSLTINDSIYYSEKAIITNSHDIDPNITIFTNSSKVHIVAQFTAKIDPGQDENYIRELTLDTVLYSKNGSAVRIMALYDSCIIYQQKKPFRLE